MEGLKTRESKRCVACGASVPEQRCAQCGAALLVRGYTMQRVIAQTPHGRVYLARDQRGDRVALKELLFSLTPGTKQIEYFEQEARTLKTLSHPAIPKFVDAFTDGEGAQRRFYLAQEFVDGRLLLHQVQEKPFSEEQTEEIARELLEILIYLHGHSPRVLHRDIKPANLITREDGRLALVDFGAARFMEDDVELKATFIGTLGYAPPEQLIGTHDETTDLYAVGATLIHLLSGRPPSEMVKENLGLQFADKVNAPALVPFLSKLVARLPKQRFQNAKQALHELNAHVLWPVRPTPHLTLIVVGLVVLAFIVAGAVWFTL